MIWKYLLLMLLICMGILTSVTDIRDGKIYNKHLLFFFVIGLVPVIGYYLVYREYIIAYLINLISSLVLAAFFYQSKIWGAGDSKEWILICCLFPYQLYILNDYMLFPSVYILMFIFLITYFYVIVESIILKGKEIKNKKPKIKSEYNNLFVKEKIVPFFFCFFQLRIFYRLCQIFFGRYYEANYLFFIFIGITFSIYISNKKFSNKYKILIISFGLILSIIDYIHYSGWKTDIISLLFVIVVMAGKDGMSRFNYQEIPTRDVRKGMVLSAISIYKFQFSKVKGLPSIPDELAKRRITEEEASAIKRWEKSSRGENTVVIVSYLPFGVFMFAGIIIYLLWGMVVNRG